MIVRRLIIPVTTHRHIEFVDLTDSLSHVVQEAGLVEGVVTVMTRHTTTGLMINEHEPLLLDDLEAMFERLVPTSTACGHDDFSRRVVNLVPEERRNGHAHCRAALLRASECIHVGNMQLDLGRWQRVFFVEFDGGQQREISITLFGRER
jgi:secondary thiamine-phosphate synthase enzyme